MVPLLTFLLWLCVYGLVAFVVVWVIIMILGLFIAVPLKVQQILYIIAGLIILIWAVQHLPVLGLP